VYAVPTVAIVAQEYAGASANTVLSAKTNTKIMLISNFFMFLTPIRMDTEE
jgi:hypothetical protein